MNREILTISPAELEESIALLVATRTNEVEDMDNGKLVLKYYTMALKDLFFNLTGDELELGQDLGEMVEADF
jgi:hypothetical protein